MTGWRDYTIEGGEVLCRDDDACEWYVEYDGPYLTVGEAVDSAKAHSAWHAKMADEEARA